MDPEPWKPGMGDGVPDDFKEGEEPPAVSLTEREPEVPDPNMEGMPTIYGYEDCNFDKKKKERPPAAHNKAVEEPVPQDLKSFPVPGEDECREAITAFADSDCCRGKEPINTLVINSINASNAYTFTLETYVEKRKVGYEYKPYKGGHVDDPSQGVTPDCWEMKVTVKELFKKDEKKLELPHTSTVRTCHYCCGVGYVLCYRCKGWGCHICQNCNGAEATEGGEGEEGGPRCGACNDTHHEQCELCLAEGRLVCPACDGYRAIRCFLQLKVTHKNHKEEYVREDTDLPDNLIKDVKGVTVFESAHDQVAPIKGCPLPDIDSKSEQFLAKHHHDLLKKKRLLHQRMKLVLVPVAEVQVTWKEEAGRFWVYGLENKVHCPDYPDNCACCVIL